MKFQLIIFIFFLCITSLGFSQADVYVYRDISNNLTVETIKNKKFELIENQILEKKSDITYWFKIPTEQTDSEYIFKILYERIKYADVYQNSNKIDKLTNERYLSYQFSRDTDVYIKIKPKLHAYIPFSLHNVEDNILKEKKELILNGFYYGFAFLIIIYNLFYYFLFKDDAFLYYALFLSSMSFGVFLMDGMLNFYNISELATNFWMILNYCLLAFFSSKFATSYLFLDLHYPKLKKFTYPIGISIIVLGLLYLIQDKELYFLLLFINLLVFSLLFIYWFTAVLLFKNNIYTKILVFAYIIILFSGIDFFVLKFLGISFGNINSVNIKIGAFLEMIILSIAVLYRMKTLRDENQYMRNKIIDFSKRINALTENQNLNKAKKLDDLSIREKQIFDLIVTGKSNKELANDLNVSVNTIKFHIKNIYEKLHIKSRKEAIDLSIE